MEKRVHLIYDTTLSNGEWALQVIDELKTKGYAVEIRVMASPWLESELGVDSRFTKDVDKRGFGRYVPEGARESIYRKIPASLDQVHAHSDVPIRIFNREGVELYDSRIDARLPGFALEQERMARLQDPAVTEKLRAGWDEQVKWHQELPERLPQNVKIDPPTQAALMRERLEKHIDAGVYRRSDGQEVVDELVRPGAPRASVHPPEIAFAPEMRRAAGVGALAGLGAAASIYDARRTAERVGTLLAQDNPLAARSELQHFAARGVGGWVGGTLTASLVGTSSATGIGLVLADAYLLSLAAERGADWLDHRSIVRQTDRDGVQWHYTGHAWQREARADLSADGVDNPQPVTAAASIEKDRELNYQASAAAAALAIRQASLQDPGVLPASGDDRASLRPAPWQRNVETGQWQRNVAVAVDRNDMAIREWQTATPERAAQLEAQAAQVIAANLGDGPAAIAARFEAAYRGNGWRDFGPLPQAVQTALHPDRLQASDGRQYQRDVDGTWQQEGERASANRAWELERTRDALLPALAQHRQAIEQIPAYSVPTGAALHQAHLQYMYRQHGTELNADWRQAITAAVEQTRQVNGLAESGAMQLLPNAAGKIAADSGIAHLRKDASGVEQVVATTTSEEIVAAWRAQKQEMAAETPRHSAMHAATASAAIASLPPMTVMPDRKDHPNDHQNGDRGNHDRPPAHADATAITVRRGFPPEHPDAPLRQAIQELLPPQTTEERLTELTVAARTAGIRGDTFKGITVHPADEMKLVLHGTIPGFMATVDLRQAAPTQEHALQRLDAYHEQQAQRHAEFQQQQERANAWERVHGPGPGGPAAPGLGM